MKLIYGTGNPGKLDTMKKALEGMDIEIVGLKELNMDFEEPEECGKIPLDNARQKAEYYYSVLKQPVFSCDSGLFIDGLTQEEQPGVHVRNVNGRRLTDPEMTAHYREIARRLGGKCTARYRNAICLILSEEERYEYEGEDISGNEFYLVDDAKEQTEEGFPLDCISVDKETGKYYTEDDPNPMRELKEGLRLFMERALKGKTGPL